MGGHWIRHRLLLSIVLSCVVILVSVLLFVFPFILSSSATYNEQSIYKNSSIDFVVPEPSFEQVSELPGTQGIDKVFPFYKTTSLVTINNQTRSTNVLMTDQMQNVDITMYNSTRLIKESKKQVTNPILIDWQFAHDTNAEIGDIITITIDDNIIDYTVSAIYETNSLYDGGAILAPITSAQKDTISNNSKNSGYSAMYISASDYSACQSYLKTDYRPLGRLKDRALFDSDEQYQIHYDAIMSSGYANEITDLRVKESSLSVNDSPLLVWIASAIVLICVIVYNTLMIKRGCEKTYFKDFCIPKGLNIKPYYSISFIFELVLPFIGYITLLAYKIMTSTVYIPKSSLFSIWLLCVPTSLLVANVVNMISNNAMVSRLIKDYKKRKNAAGVSG